MEISIGEGLKLSGQRSPRAIGHPSDTNITIELFGNKGDPIALKRTVLASELKSAIEALEKL